MNKSLITTLLLCFACLVSGFFGCADSSVTLEKDVEYRRGNPGSIPLLYKIGDSKPFGSGKPARLTGYHDNGKKKFEFTFYNGLRHGPFMFWHSNGMKHIQGTFLEGLRHGNFTSFGQAGELVYSKNFSEDEMDGNFTLYYPMSRSETFRYFEFLEKRKLSPKDVPVESNIRLEAKFVNGIPVGRYQIFYHPNGQKKLTKLDLLKEEGFFDPEGRLQGTQVCYYPRTEGLMVFAPNNEFSDTIHEPNPVGLSRAIDECYSMIDEIPAYRNPKDLPAKVFAIDANGQKIAPIWSSEVESLAIRNSAGFILPQRFEPNYESYSTQALPKANEILIGNDLSQNSSGNFGAQESFLEIVGLNANGTIVDIFWCSAMREDVVDLDERILRKRRKIQRLWDGGNSNQSEWQISDGLRLAITEDKEFFKITP